MKSLGMRINEKGEILCRYKGKEEKIGQARPSTPEEIARAEAMEKKSREINKN